MLSRRGSFQLIPNRGRPSSGYYECYQPLIDPRGWIPPDKRGVIGMWTELNQEANPTPIRGLFGTWDSNVLIPGQPWNISATAKIAPHSNTRSEHCTLTG